MLATIFDFDQTLVDSRSLSELRRKRAWGRVYQSISEISEYSGITQILQYLRQNKIKIALVTNSPRPYIIRAITRLNWQFDTTVCYHDTSQHKPHPAPLIKAARNLKVNVCDIWAIGDNPNDIIAANRAGMHSIAALWGTDETYQITLAEPKESFDTVESFQRRLTQELNR